MKKNINLLILFFSIGTLQSQDFNQTKYQFSKKVFEKDYVKTKYERFKGKIVIENETTISYDEKTLVIPNVNKDLKLIFINGIFYPNVIFGNKISEAKVKTEINKMTPTEKVFYNMSRTDSLVIGNMEELKLLNPNYQTKRFLIWVYTKGTMNPTECYLEIQNRKAKRETSVSEFMRNAVLTFFKSGTVII